MKRKINDLNFNALEKVKVKVVVINQYGDALNEDELGVRVK